MPKVSLGNLFVVFIILLVHNVKFCNLLDRMISTDVQLLSSHKLANFDSLTVHCAKYQLSRISFTGLSVYLRLRLVNINIQQLFALKKRMKRL